MLQISKLITAVFTFVVTANPPLDEATTLVIPPVLLVPDVPLEPEAPAGPEEPLVPDEPDVPDEPEVPLPPDPLVPLVSIKIQSSEVIEKSIVLDWKPLMVKTPLV